MNTKKIQLFFDVFARIAATIFLFSSIYIAVFFGTDVVLRISYIWGVLFISLAATIGRIPFFTDKEISKTKMLAGNIIYVIFLNILVMVSGYYLEWFHPGENKMIIGLEITIFVVYASVMVLSYLADLKTAKKITEKLKNRKEKTDE
jgi:hypothetical protein